MGYNATLKSGKEIFINDWSPTVALENLSSAGKYIGLDQLLLISEVNEVSIHTVILSISESDDPKTTMNLIKHFICTVGIDGTRVENHNFDEFFGKDLMSLVEVFCHVVKAQYADFFEQGLIKV